VAREGVGEKLDKARGGNIMQGFLRAALRMDARSLSPLLKTLNQNGPLATEARRSTSNTPFCHFQEKP